MAVNTSELDFAGLRVTCITTKPFRPTYDGSRNIEREENKREPDEREGSRHLYVRLDAVLSIFRVNSCRLCVWLVTKSDR